MNQSKNDISRLKAIVLDLDETLLHSDGSISEYTLRVLQECRNSYNYSNSKILV